MKEKIIGITFLAASTMCLMSCQKENVQTPAAIHKERMKPMNSGIALEMPANGAYKAWIQNAVVTTNPLRLNVFKQAFAGVEQQHAILNYTMVNVSIDRLGQESIGVIVEQNPNVPMDGGIYTMPTGEQYRYGWVLGVNGIWYPGKFWNIGGEWVFFPFDRADQMDNNMYPFDSGIDMDNLAIFTRLKTGLKYA